MVMGFSCRESAFFQAPIKLAQPFRPQNCGQKFYGHEDFSDSGLDNLSDSMPKEGMRSIGMNTSDTDTDLIPRNLI